MTLAFPCNGCGACCKSVGMAPEVAGFDRGDGVCRHFDDEASRCGIYENRPAICNVQQMYELRFKRDYAWPEYVALNLQACAGLQEAVLRRSAPVGPASPG